MKKVLAVCAMLFAIIALGVVALIVFVFSLTKPVVETGDKFVTLLGSGDGAHAYELCSEDLRNQRSPQALEAYAKKHGFTQSSAASWSNRSIKDKQGHLDGTVKTTNGDVHLTLELVNENGNWKISTINNTEFLTETAPTVPPAEQLDALALNTLLAFNKSAQENSFGSFYETTSKMWRQQTTAEKLTESFKTFKANISSIANVKPVWDGAPKLDSNGLLLLKGHYPTKPAAVHFELKYVFETTDWKLLGININMK